MKVVGWVCIVLTVVLLVLVGLLWYGITGIMETDHLDGFRPGLSQGAKVAIALSSP